MAFPIDKLITIESLNKEIADLKEQLKLKTQNEINASINKDCLDGQIILNKDYKDCIAKLAPWASAAQEDQNCCQELLDIFLIVIDLDQRIKDASN